MRSSLSCDQCRRSKVKCANSGTAPCQRCERLGTQTCVLSRPISQTRPKSRRPVLVSLPAPALGAGAGHLGVLCPAAPQDTRELAPSTNLASCEASSPSTVELPQGRPEAYRGGHDVESHLIQMSDDMVFKALDIFIKKFPELAFLHLPSFMDEFRTACSPQTKALLGAILAIVRNQVSVMTPAWMTGLLPPELYAAYTEELLSKLFLQPPKIQVVQALLVMTLYEWGAREFHKSWVYCGMAIRIMQAIHSLRIATYHDDAAPDGGNEAVAYGMENRAYWACLIMDCMVSCGTYHPRMLPMREMEQSRVIRPLTAVEFAFGEQSHSEPLGSRLPTVSTGILDMTHNFEILAHGFDIWSKAMDFVLNDGRRAPGMTAPENCPWVPTSAWARLNKQLHEWRASQHPRLYYPNSSVTIYMTLGHGESFVYLNLLYYLNIIALHREYFPFIPKAHTSEPCGPTDPPFLEADAPEGWWHESARQLFEAAEYITDMLHEAFQCGAFLMTPFPGFSCFAACFLNSYVLHFPAMNLGRSRRAAELFDRCVGYLNKFRPTCSLGDGWIKTINHCVLLHRKITQDRSRYSNKSRADFNVLHCSVHEFRIVDRSNQHLNEISTAEMNTSPSILGPSGEDDDSRHQSPDDSRALGEFFAETASNYNDLSDWPYWWSSVEGRNMNPFENT